jgi:hypothetical protein
VKADVHLIEAGSTASTWFGTSREETADMNDILPFEVTPGNDYVVTVRSGWTETQTRVQATASPEQVVIVPLSSIPQITHASQACYLPVAGARPALGRLLPRP